MNPIQSAGGGLGANGSAAGAFRISFIEAAIFGGFRNRQEDEGCFILNSRKQKPGNFVCLNMEKMKNRLIFKFATTRRIPVVHSFPNWKRIRAILMRQYHFRAGTDSLIFENLNT
jgi:hypothetical protein